MKVDSLKQFVALRAALTQEKARLESRLAEINRVLGTGPEAAARVARLNAGRRNAMSLREAVARATKDKALTKQEILQAIDKLGYKFTASDPMNSLNVALYTPGNFKNNGDGTFRALKK